MERRSLRRGERVWSRLGRCDLGASGVELALLAPLLIGAVAVMIEIGLEVTARMEVARGVRAGAQAVIARADDPARIAEIVRVAAGAPAGMTVDVSASCACGAAAAACSARCDTGGAPSVFVVIAARVPYAAPVRGSRILEAATRVQVR